MSTANRSDRILSKDAIERRVREVFSEADLSSKAAMREELEPDVFARREEIRRAIPEVAAAHQAEVSLAAAVRQRRPLANAMAAARIVGALLVASFVVCIVSVAAGSYTAYPFVWISFPPPDYIYPAPTIVLCVGLTATSVGLMACAEYLYRRSGRNQLFAASQRELEENIAAANGRLRSEVGAIVRELVNTRATLLGELDVLDTVEAPRLVEIDQAETVRANGVVAVRSYIERHDTSAVGIAGTRGVGKSTIMRSLTAPGHADFVGAYIQAPVYYGARDFVRLIHAEVARAILRESGDYRSSHGTAPTLRGRGPRLPLTTAGAGLAVVILDLLAGGPQSLVGGLSQAGLLGLVVAATGAVFALAALARSAPTLFGRRASRRGRPIVEVAADHLRNLDWTRNYSAKSSANMKMSELLSLGSEEQIGGTEREKTHPELVADLRRFLGEYAETGLGKPLVIAVDELDKIADPKQAIDLVNSLKDMFHMVGSHFLVSVSEDALTNFALRGVPVRDVFDSAFDEVFRVPPFALNESKQLLSQRVVRFPLPAVHLCHAFSGGLPRELLRDARRCVEHRRTEVSGRPVKEVAEALLASELSELAGGYLSRFGEDDDRSIHAIILSFSRAVADPAGLRALRCATWRAGEPYSEIRRAFAMLPVRLQAVSTVLITACDLVCGVLADLSWKTIVVDEKFERCVEELASLRRQVADSPHSVLDHLETLKVELVGRYPSILSNG